MEIKSKIGEKILLNSNSYQHYMQQYQKQIQEIKKQQQTINNLKKENQQYQKNLKKKNNQIKKIQKENNEIKQKITQNNQTHNNKITQIKAKHEQEITQKNNQIKKIQKENSTFIEEISLIKNTLEKYEQTLTNIENDKNNNLHFIEKNLNYLTIKLDSKSNENERKLISELNNLNKKCKSYLISIIIPVYNLEKYVEKCFLSILNQSIGFHNLEIIFVDDCSTDNTYNILKEYATNYSNVKLFQTGENSGVAGKPRNIGMKYATSDYIMFLDGDDEYYEDACEFLYDKIVESGSSIVSGTYTQWNTVTNQEEIPFFLLLNTFTDNNLGWTERVNNLEQFNLEFPEEIMITDIQELPFIINNYKLASKIFNLKFLRDNKIIFPEFIIAEDSVFLYKSLVSAEKLIFNKKAIYKYNETRNEESDKSVTFSDDMDLQISRLDAYGMIYDFGLENGLEDITVKYLINGKMAYFFNTFVLNKDLSCDILIEIFDRCKFLCALLLRDDVVLADNLRELYSLIVNDKYDDAMNIC